MRPLRAGRLGGPQRPGSLAAPLWPWESSASESQIPEHSLRLQGEAGHQRMRSPTQQQSAPQLQGQATPWGWGPRLRAGDIRLLPESLDKVRG